MVHIYNCLLFALFFGLASSASEGVDSKQHYALILSGGADKDNNNQRYLENVSSMYGAFRANDIPDDNIKVLYGSGKVEDTRSLATEPQFPPEDGSTNSIQESTSAKTAKKTKVASSQSALSEDYLFGEQGRKLDGAANYGNVKAKILDILGKMKNENDDLTLYITDHGSQAKEGESPLIVLWGETMSADQLAEILDEIPPTHKVKIVTNMCYGGGLTELTSSNICVMANQQEDKLTYSQSSDLDLYGQNFPYALKNKIDADGNKSFSLMDAHLYAANLENPKNKPTTSLDWFLAQNRDKILAAKAKKTPKKSQKTCSLHPDKAVKEIARLADSFDKLNLKDQLSTESIQGTKNEHFLEGRLNQAIDDMKRRRSVKIAESLEPRVKDLKNRIKKSGAAWKNLTPQEKLFQRKKFNLEAQQLKGELKQLENEQSKFEKVTLELDLLKYGDEDMIKEYESIRSCLEEKY